MNRPTTARVLVAGTVVATALLVTAAPAHPLTPDQQLVRQLPTAVTAGAPDYDRALFGSWTDRDGDGCDARRHVLLRDLHDVVTDTTRPSECTVLSGQLQDPYTGIVAEVTAAQVDIDHRVALQDAWTSGANTWTEEWRHSFTNDEDNLVATRSGVNRAKGSRGPDQWQPAGGKAERCAYAAGYAHTKARWGLGVTDAQRAALLRLLDGC